MAPKKELKGEEPESNYVTQEQFGKFSEVILSAVEKIGKQVAGPAEIKREVQIAEASTDDQMTVPPAWEKKAKEILGDNLDHCELDMRGGTIFTVVIKNEFSNASKDYLARYKADRRSKELGNEGISGVEEWCKLIALNLKRK